MGFTKIFHTKILRSFFNKVVVPHCILCDQVIDRGWICQECLTTLPWCDPKEHCTRCFAPKSALFCRCSHRYFWRQAALFDRTEAVIRINHWAKLRPGIIHDLAALYTLQLSHLTDWPSFDAILTYPQNPWQKFRLYPDHRILLVKKIAMYNNISALQSIREIPTLKKLTFEAKNIAPLQRLLIIDTHLEFRRTKSCAEALLRAGCHELYFLGLSENMT